MSLAWLFSPLFFEGGRWEKEMLIRGNVIFVLVIFCVDGCVEFVS